MNKVLELAALRKQNPNLTKKGTRGSLERLGSLVTFVNRYLLKHEKIDRDMVPNALQEHGKAGRSKPKRLRDSKGWATTLKMAQAHCNKGHKIVGLHWQICALTGLRPWQEAARLRWSYFDHENQCLRIPGNEMKISGEKRENGGLPDVFVKYLSDETYALLCEWENDDQQQRYIHDKRIDYIFPSRTANGKSLHLTSNSDFKKSVEAELDYKFETRALRSFYITTLLDINIKSQVRLGLVDHSRNELDIQLRVYNEETDPRWDRALMEAEHFVGNELMAIVDPEAAKEKALADMNHSSIVVPNVG